ncbi:MAG: hypothetical protein N3B12_04840 [Armatimonadetes bacterium]|nr:hypothetical protein [Armatimonadota bacterium]
MQTINGRQASAIELLLSYPDSTVAEMLGVKLKTLLRWMATPEFAEALREREKHQRQTLGRLARQAALKAAVSLVESNGIGEKRDPKVLLETLKLSGAFETPELDPEDALAQIVDRTMRSEDSA